MIGRFITVEGIDGSGKTTLAQGLAQWMAQEVRIPFVNTAEPYGHEGIQHRELQSRVSNLALATLDCQSIPERQANYFLYLANRAVIHIDSHLQQGFHVIQDRYIDSTCAYHQDVDPRGTLTRIVHNYLQWPVPDVTFMLVVDVNIAFQRLHARDPLQNISPENAIPSLAMAQQGLITQHAEFPNRICAIDASQSPREVLEIAKRILREKFEWTERSNSPYDPGRHLKWKKKKSAP